MRNFQRHNAWVSERLGDLVVAIAKGNAQRVMELKALVLTPLPSHGENSDGFGMNEVDIRFHLNRAESRLYGDGDRREGIANFLARKEEQVARMQQKLRDLGKRATRGQNVEYARQELTDELMNLTVLTDNLKDEVAPIQGVYDILMAEAALRGITPVEVQTAPELQTATTAVRA